MESDAILCERKRTITIGSRLRNKNRNKKNRTLYLKQRNYYALLLRKSNKRYYKKFDEKKTQRITNF